MPSFSTARKGWHSPTSRTSPGRPPRGQPPRSGSATSPDYAVEEVPGTSASEMTIIAGPSCLRRIPETSNIDYQTVQDYVRSDAYPDWQPGHTRPSSLDRFDADIRRRLAEGSCNSRYLLRELRGAGYHGGRAVVKVRLRRLKNEAGLTTTPNPASPTPCCLDMRRPVSWPPRSIVASVTEPTRYSGRPPACEPPTPSSERPWRLSRLSPR